MNKYKCPDCGKTWEQTAPQSCPECGCPSTNFIVSQTVDYNKAIANNTSANYSGENSEQKIYYSDSICTIGDRIWEFKGISSNDSKGIWIFPVHNISVVTLGQKYPKWWYWILIGILLIPTIIGAIICFIIAYSQSQQKVLKVLSNDSNSGFIFDDINSLQQAQKYIVPMRQCLLSNKK